MTFKETMSKLKNEHIYRNTKTKHRTKKRRNEKHGPQLKKQRKGHMQPKCSPKSIHILQYSTHHNHSSLCRSNFNIKVQGSSSYGSPHSKAPILHDSQIQPISMQHRHTLQNPMQRAGRHGLRLQFRHRPDPSNLQHFSTMLAAKREPFPFIVHGTGQWQSVHTDCVEFELFVCPFLT